MEVGPTASTTRPTLHDAPGQTDAVPHAVARPSAERAGPEARENRGDRRSRAGHGGFTPALDHRWFRGGQMALLRCSPPLSSPPRPAPASQAPPPSPLRSAWTT